MTNKPKTKKQLISIPVNGVTLEGKLAVMPNSEGIVVFAHGAGSSRHSPRNNFVAEFLRETNLSTLLFDLLTEKEDQIYENRFDIPLLTRRLVKVTHWVGENIKTDDFKIGYFGSSTGASAALRAAAKLKGLIDAVVSRGGRTDLADNVLGEVVAPTLFIVGGADETVKKLNQESLKLLNTEKRLEIVEGAGHLFEGEGELEQVARHARKWFIKYLA